MEKILYTLMNPTEAGLVDKPADWGGVSSWPTHVTGEPQIGRWIDYTKLRELRKKNPYASKAWLREQATIEYEVPIHAPPAFETCEEYHAKLRARIERCVAFERKLRARDRRRLVGMPNVRKEEWGKKPRHSKRSPRPLCHAHDRELRMEYKKLYRHVVACYRRAMRKWRSGKRDVTFPAGTHPPGWRRCGWHWNEKGARDRASHLVGAFSAAA